MRRAETTFFLATMVAVLILLLTARTEALVFCVTNGVDVHLYAPTGTLTQSGWQQTVMIDATGGTLNHSNFLGTIIHSNALLTAAHIWEIKTNDTFTLEGEHTLVSRVATNGSDLAIYFFTPPVTNQELIALINIEPDIDTNARVVFQGTGAERGALVTAGALTNGWLWSGTNWWACAWGTRRWGINQTFGSTDDGLCAVAAFDNNGDPDECMLSIGDSGGPGFITTDSGWKVALINYSVHPATFTLSTNTPVTKFNASLYDCAGLYYELANNVWQWVPPEDSPAPCLLICSRTSQRVQWITNQVSGMTFPADLGISWVCQTNHPSATQAASGLRFDIIASNAGPYTARNIAIDVTWPLGLHINASSATQGSFETNRWSLPLLHDGGVATLRVDTVVWNMSGTWGTNTAVIHASDKPDKNTSNNAAECPIFLPATATLIQLW